MVYIELFHGRKNPREDMDGWGTVGPVLGPFQYVHITYACNIKLGTDDGFECLVYTGPEGELKDLVYYDEVFYGEISIFSVDKMVEFPELQARRVEYDKEKAITYRDNAI